MLHWVSHVLFFDWVSASSVFNSSYLQQYHLFRCTTAKGEDSNECERFAKYYRALCPGEWVCTFMFQLHFLLSSSSIHLLNNVTIISQVDKWNEQRETGTFPGPLWFGQITSQLLYHFMFETIRSCGWSWNLTLSFV